MPQIDIFNRTFLRGLQTTRDNDGAVEFAGFQQFHNNRVGTDEAARRPGRTLVADLTGFQQSSLFDGVANMMAGALPPLFDLDDDWCLEILASPATWPTSGQLITFGLNAALTVQLNAGTWEAKGVYAAGGGFSTSAPATGSTLVDLVAVTKVGTTLTVIVNGVAGTPLVLTGLIATPTQWLSTFDVVYGSSFNGNIDFWRYLKEVPATWAGRERRLFNPRSDNVMADYVGAPSSHSIILDRGRYEQHIAVYPTATVPSASSSIGPPHQPIQGMEIFTDEFDRPQLFLVAGGREFQGAL